MQRGGDAPARNRSVEKTAITQKVNKITGTLVMLVLPRPFARHILAIFKGNVEISRNCFGKDGG